MTNDAKQMPYVYIEGGARGVAERAIRFAREGEAMEMIREFSLFKAYLDMLLEKQNLSAKKEEAAKPFLSF